MKHQMTRIQYNFRYVLFVLLTTVITFYIKEKYEAERSVLMILACSRLMIYVRPLCETRWSFIISMFGENEDNFQPLITLDGYLTTPPYF